MPLSRTSLVTTFVLSLAAGAVATIAPPAPAAHACGDFQAPRRALGAEATDVVARHFAALADGDLDAVRALWAPGAKATSIDAHGRVTRVRSIGLAARRWIADRDGLRWTIGDATVRADGAVEVTAEVTWAGARYHDVLRLAPGDDGALRLTAKSSRRVAEVRDRGGHPAGAY
ncbi:MAG: hypothetical protein H6708_26655 [Kofleriaceae bacterium]|nr:hypothetical protein [Kofleriaceae bacterium]